MVEIVKTVSGIVATCSEFTAVVVIVIGSLQALGSMVKTLIEWKTTVSPLLVFDARELRRRQPVSRVRNLQPSLSRALRA
jgi:hypothetical protein